MRKYSYCLLATVGSENQVLLVRDEYASYARKVRDRSEILVAA